MKNAVASDLEANQEKCFICLENLSTQKKIVELPCKHKFHKKCLNNWIRENPTCPLCRQDIAGNQNTTSGKTNHNGLQPLNRRCSIDSRLIYISLGVGTVGFVCAFFIYYCTTLVYFSDEDPSLNSSLSE
jgi:hypothetical protein